MTGAEEYAVLVGKSSWGTSCLAWFINVSSASHSLHPAAQTARWGCISPHDSRRLLLQPPIRKSILIEVFFLRARIMLRALDLASAVTTHLTAGGLAAQSVNILFQVCLPSSRLHAPVSRGISMVSSRILVNNAGLFTGFSGLSGWYWFTGLNGLFWHEQLPS
jgi:hypothetical protein